MAVNSDMAFYAIVYTHVKKKKAILRIRFV